MVTPQVFELNRRLFIKWTQGILLERDRSGKCIVLDGSEFARKCAEAEAALGKGGLVYLTEGGKRVTQVMVGKTGYEEVLYAEAT